MQASIFRPPVRVHKAQVTIVQIDDPKGTGLQKHLSDDVEIPIQYDHGRLKTRQQVQTHSIKLASHIEILNRSRTAAVKIKNAVTLTGDSSIP
jgi:hypothetical protein